MPSTDIEARAVSFRHPVEQRLPGLLLMFFTRLSGAARREIATADPNRRTFAVVGERISRCRGATRSRPGCRQTRQRQVSRVDLGRLLRPERHSPAIAWASGSVRHTTSTELGAGRAHRLAVQQGPASRRHRQSTPPSLCKKRFNLRLGLHVRDGPGQGVLPAALRLLGRGRPGRRVPRTSVEGVGNWARRPGRMPVRPAAPWWRTH